MSDFTHLPAISDVLNEDIMPTDTGQVVENRFSVGLAYADSAFVKCIDIADEIKVMASDIDIISIDITPLDNLREAAEYIKGLVGELDPMQIAPGDLSDLIAAMTQITSMVDAMDNPWSVSLDGLTSAIGVINELKSNVMDLSPVDFVESAYTGAVDAINDIKDGAAQIQPINIDNAVLDGAQEAIDEIKNLATVTDTIDIDEVLAELDIDIPPITTPTLDPAPSMDDFYIDMSSLVAPALSFNWSDEILYTSTLLELLKGEIQDDIGGSQVISSTVEDAMFARETERDLEVLSDAKARIAADWGEFNWPLPDAALAFNQNVVDINYQNKMLDKARAIQEQVEKLGLENMWKAREIGSQMERDLMTYGTSMMQRKLDAAKAIIEAAIKIFELKVAEIEAKIKAFLGMVEVYKATADVKLKEFQLIITVIEANVRLKTARASLLVEKARLLVAMYGEENRIKIEAINGIQRIAEKRTDARIEEGRMAIAQFTEAIRLRIASMDDVDKVVVSRTAAYTEQVKLAVNKYLEDIRLRIAAITGVEGVVSSKARTLIAQLQMSVTQFVERIRARIAGVEAATRVGAIEENLLLENSKLAITEFLENMRMKLNATGVIEKLSADRMTVILEKAKAEIAQYLEQVRLKMTALESVASTLAQVCAGAMASVSATAHISATESLSTGAQISFTGTESYPHAELPNT